MSQTALITGASSGIGAAFARHLAREGYGVVLVARRVDKLEALAKELAEAHGVSAHVVPLDLLTPDAPQALLRAIAERDLQVDLLVNNAGIGIHGPFADGTYEDDARTIALNVSAVTALTRAFLPGMIARRSGAVLNVASTAAFQPVPYFAVYAATKAYVLAFSEAIAEEVAQHGIRVSCVCPGPTESEFADHAAFKTDLVDKAPMMTADDVVKEALGALKSGRAVQVPGLMNNLSAFAPRLFPRQLVAKISGTLFKPNK